MSAPGPAPRSWLISSLLPEGTMHILAAAPGAGKSLLSTQLAASLISGVPFLGFDIPRRLPPSSIYFIYTDRPGISNTHATTNLPPGVRVYCALDDPDYAAQTFLRPSDRFSWLLSRVNPSPGSFVVVDVFGTKLAGGITDPRQVETNIERISYEVTHRRKVTMLAIGYGVKVKSGSEKYARTLDNIQGCASFRGAFDAQFYLASTEESDAEGAQILTALVRTMPVRSFTLRNESGTFVLTSAAEVAFAASTTPLGSLVLSLLVSGPVPRTTLLEAIQSARPGYQGGDMLLRRLTLAGDIVRQERGVYALPGPAQPAAAN